MTALTATPLNERPLQLNHSNTAPEDDAATAALQNPQDPPNILFQWMEACAANLFSSCEGGVNSTTLQDAVRNEALHSLDYAQLHDHFLESLLQEAAKPQPAKNGGSSSLYTGPSAFPEDSDSSVLSSSNIGRRRRLPRLTRKLSSPDRNKSKEAPGKLPQAQAPNPQALPPGKPYDPLAPPPLLPAHFLHDYVRMQKDKGRGEEPGSLICAKGQDACLDKLRAKMQLLCNTAIQEKGASMKRRPARVSIHLDNFVETRSILEVRLGFLSMMYGILLRWDTNITGKITLVVLRKMCHESFYPAVAASAPPSLAAVSSGSSSSAEEDEEDPASPTRRLRHEASSTRLVEGKANQAIVDWPDGTEVAILEPPFLIARPDSFTPSILTIASISASGLDPRSHWMVQVVWDQKVVNLPLVHDHKRRVFTPKKQAWQSLTYEIQAESLDTSPPLDVKLFQHRNSRRRRCVGTMQVPLANLPLSSNTEETTHLSFPCQDSATMDLDLSLVSESLAWTQTELEARRKASSFFWQTPAVTPTARRPVSPPPPLVVSDNEEEDEEDDAWGWMLCYSMC